MAKEQQKCKCGAKNGMACKNCSRVRLVIMTSHQYKNTLPETQRYNPVYYSRVRINNWSEPAIADATFDHLTADAKMHDALSGANLVIAYSNHTGNEIKRFTA